MPYPKKNIKSRNVAGFGAFIKKYFALIIFGILSIVFIIPILKRWIDRQKTLDIKSDLTNEISVNSAQNNTSNPDIIQKKTQKIASEYPNLSKSKIEEIKTNAFKMAYALGTNVDDNHALFGGMVQLYNVRAWKEDEKTAIAIAKKHTGTFPVLEKFYYSVATKSHSLRTDLLKLLSKDDLDEIREAHKKYGNYKFL